jgi:hypothetical protein
VGKRSAGDYRVLKLATRLEEKSQIVVVFGMTIIVLAWLISEVSGLAKLEALSKLIGSVAAYTAALVMTLRIAREHRQVGGSAFRRNGEKLASTIPPEGGTTYLLRIGWLAMAANAGIFILRPLVETSLWNQIVPGYSRSPLQGFLLHLLIIPANCFFLCGVLAMWKAYSGIGLGFRIRGRDYAAMAAILALMFALMFYREHLTEAQSPILASRLLQPFGLALLSICAAMSLVLYRISMQMGGGRLAVALRWLTAFALLRASLVLIRSLKLEFVPDSIWPGVYVNYVIEIGWLMVPWTFALAAVCRAEITVTAARELKERRAARGELYGVSS